MNKCNSEYYINGVIKDENGDTVALDVSTPKLRFTNYAITDNVPGFWIQHSTDGFICAIPYELENDVLRTKALAISQKICTALEQYDNNTSKN